VNQDFDALVVGSGAGGSACAWAMADAGMKVLVLEAGPEYLPQRDYRLNRPDWEGLFPHKVPTVGRQSFAPMQRLDSAYDDLRSWNHLSGLYNPGSHRVAWGYHHVIGLGGSTLHFTGEAHRLHPAAMKMKTRFGVAADWPVTYSELEPFYVEAERVVGVAGASRDPHRPRSVPYPLPPHEPSFASRRLGQGFRDIGCTWTPNPLAALTRAYEGRPPCNYCGGCLRGCNRRDKGSADLTFLARARKSGRCHILTDHHVTGLEVGTGDKIRGVRAVDGGGKEVLIEAAVIALACGAVETPRLLLNSVGAGGLRSVGNESGLVGKNLMETLTWVSSGLHPENLGSHRGHPVDSICWDFNSPDSIEGVPGGCRFGPSMAESDLVGPINHARRMVGGWGREHAIRMRETFGKALSIAGIGESLPNDGTFVDLDPVETDAHGQPVARIHSRVDEVDIARLRFMRDICNAALEASGVPKILEQFSTYDIFSATHVAGTCRMGAHEGDSVVDPDLRSHRWKNLYVVDASVFPSSGGGESPSLTINALAIRAGRHIAALGVPSTRGA
jgi:choline dehydrogenase-like flavoprotein